MVASTVPRNSTNSVRLRGRDARRAEKRSALCHLDPDMACPPVFARVLFFTMTELGQKRMGKSKTGASRGIGLEIRPAAYPALTRPSDQQE